MSRKILIDSLSDKIRDQISNELEIKVEGSTFVFKAKPKFIYPMDVTDTHAYVPFAYGRTCVGGPYPCPERNTYLGQNPELSFIGELRPIQKEIKTEAIQDLNKYGSTIISAYPGCGKTSIAIYISTKIKIQTLIVTHRIVLINQWKEAIKKFCPNANIQVLNAKSTMVPGSPDENCDFYIMNATNIPKHPKSFYKKIGFVCIDEIHLIMAESLSKCMQQLVPRYVLGLSATPYREDDLNILLDLYFGTKKIDRKLYREHIIYKLQTSFVPTVELASNGKINWGVILDTQAGDKGRNEMIINIVKFFKSRVFLIICKRVEQGKYIVKRLKEEEEDVTSLIGKQQEYEQKSRILVGTTGKCSTGFDHPRLNTLILASDIQAYFVQVLGRIMRTQVEDSKEKHIPMVIDIVDKNPILERHYKVRRTVYLEHGGKIKDFSREFPDFKPG